MPKNIFRRSIQIKLLLRLCLAGIAISVLLGAGVFLRERNRVSDIVIERAVQSVRHINIQIMPLLDSSEPPSREEFQRKIVAFSRGVIYYEEGRYVIVRIYGLDGRILMEDLEPEFDDPGPATGYLDSADHLLHRDKAWHEIVRIEGAPYIHVDVPLENSSGNIAAHIEGMFAVSDSEISAIRRRMLRSAFLGMLIVMGTTALVYPIISSLIGRLSRLTTGLLDANLETMQVLGNAIAKRDSDTDAHNYRVTIYAVRIAESVGLDIDSIRTLIKGAFLHDVGKIGIRDDILLKPGKLTDDEFDIMKLHVNHGLDIVNRSDWLLDAGSVVGAHHEKFDGTGYFRGLSGSEIPVTARIFALADVFDALTSRRPYKEPFTFEESMHILLNGSGTHFDPDLLDAFQGIAHPLYEEFASTDDQRPRLELEEILIHYFQKEVESLV
jgi:HD-GYP domain-containing protein (c-di-GMP phosphodiesterase class II)